MVIKKLREFLDSQHIQYSIISHSPANTAQKTAATAHVRGKELAKTVMIKADGVMVMAVLPANYMIDFALLKGAIGADSISLATEAEFSTFFPDCEPGAMPPFGNLYNMDIIVEESLMADREIAFNAGSHTELVKMSYADFANLTKPKVRGFSVKRH